MQYSCRNLLGYTPDGVLSSALSCIAVGWVMVNPIMYPVGFHALLPCLQEGPFEFTLNVRGGTLKHFKAEGSLFRSMGIAGKGTSKRKVLLLGMGFFGFVFMSIVVFLLRSAGLDREKPPYLTDHVEWK